MTTKTKNQKANYMQRQQSRQNRDTSIAMLARVLRLPTQDEILLQYGHFPSRFHIDPVK